MLSVSTTNTWTVCICFQVPFQWQNVVKSEQLFDNLQMAVHFNHQNRGADRMPNIAKKETFEEKVKKHLLISLQKTKSSQTSGSVFEDRIEQVEKTKFEYN